MLFVSRRRLLAGTAVACTLLGLSAPAQAECVRTGNTVTCGNTITIDAVNTGPSPSNDRSYVFNLTTGPATITVGQGNIVSGFGLAADSMLSSGTNSISVVNNGTIQIDAGNDPVFGGDAALQINGAGASNLSYSGSGNVINNGGGSFADALVLSTVGSGSITANVGGNVSARPGGGFGVAGLSYGVGGNVALTLGQFGTIRVGDTGMLGLIFNAASGGNITLNNSGSILSPAGSPGTLGTGMLAETNGTGSITITNSGRIGLATDRAGIAIDASIGNSSSAGQINVSSTGTLFASQVGIQARTVGTGAISVTTGAETVNVDAGTGGGIGIRTDATSGQTTVTVGVGGISARTNGILAGSTTGAQTFNIGGQVASTLGNSDAINATSNSGAITVNVLAGGGLTGVDDAVSLSTSGLKTVDIAAGRTVSGNFGIYSQGTGATTIVNRGTLSGQQAAILASAPGNGAFTITNHLGATLNGRIVLSGAADTLTNAGTFNVSSDTDFGLGTDVLTNQTGGVIGVANGTLIRGLETLSNAGTLNVLAGLDLTNAATALTNTGTMNLVGVLNFAGGGSFTNSGTLNAVGGAASITGLTGIANSGTINLRDGAANDTLTINGNYAASTGAVLNVDFSQSASDRLVITGNATGTTRVVATAVPGTARIDAAGLMLVDVGGTAAAGAFFTNDQLNPLINLSVQQRSGDFFLVALPNANGLRPLAVGNLVTDLWYHSADLVSLRTQGERKVRMDDEERFAPRFWLQGGFARDRYGDKDATVEAFGNVIAASTRQQGDRWGIQAGADLPLGAASVGVTGGYQRGDTKFGGEEVAKASGFNVGAYATAGGMKGPHASLLAKYDRTNVKLDRTVFVGLDGAPDSSSIGLDGHVGYGIPFGPDAVLDIDGGLAVVRTKLDRFSAGSITFDFDRQTSVRGDVGAKFGLGGMLAPYVEARLFREFKGDTDLTLTSGTSDTVRGQYRGTWARIGAGLGGSREWPILASAWADLGDVTGAGVKLGLAF